MLVVLEAVLLGQVLVVGGPPQALVVALVDGGVRAHCAVLGCNIHAAIGEVTEGVDTN